MIKKNNPKKEFFGLMAKMCFTVLCREAGCTPFVASMMADIFPADLRGAALGVYNWGIYMGYSMSYALGNLITDADINGQVRLRCTKSRFISPVKVPFFFN